MSAAPFNPIEWKLDMSGCPVWGNTALTPTVKSNLLTAAVHAVWSATGRRWSTSQRSIRPTTSCGCRSFCSHRRGMVDVIDLRHYVANPLRVEDVIVGGVSAVVGVDYWVGNRQIMPMTDGVLDPWPTQDLGTADGSATSWSIIVTYGEEPPQLALFAAADIACMMAKRFLNMPCEIPDNALSVTREGVTVRLAQGLAGMPSFKMLMDAYPKMRRTRRLVDPAKFRPAGIVEIDDYRFEQPACAGMWVEEAGLWVWSERSDFADRPLTVRVGSVESFEFTFTERIDGEAVPIDITGRTYEADIRDAEGAVVASFSCVIVDALEGIVSISLSAEESALLTAGGTYFWDLRETGAGTQTLFANSRLFAVAA